MSRIGCAFETKRSTERGCIKLRGSLAEGEVMAAVRTQAVLEGQGEDLVSLAEDPNTE